MSFSYFENVIEEVRERKMPSEYWRHLQMRVDRLEQQWSTAEVRAFVTERAMTPAAVDFGELCYGKRQPAIRPAPRRRLDHNVDIPAQSG